MFVSDMPIQFKTRAYRDAGSTATRRRQMNKACSPSPAAKMQARLEASVLHTTVVKHWGQQPSWQGLIDRSVKPRQGSHPGGIGHIRKPYAARRPNVQESCFTRWKRHARVRRRRRFESDATPRRNEFMQNVPQYAACRFEFSLCPNLANVPPPHTSAERLSTWMLQSRTS